MCRYSRIIIFFNHFILILNIVLTAPTIEKIERSSANFKNSKSEVERSLEQFLNVYYDEFVQKEEKHSTPENDIYETMQGDQPAESSNFPTAERNITDMEYVRAMRNRNRHNDLDERSREHWIQILKENILRQIGRDNATVIPKPDARLSSLNVSDIIPGFFNSTITFNDDQVGEKIRSFYPSCEVPLNTDQDIWKDDDVMNLYFNFDHSADTRNTNIATATLRLYRLPENSTKFNTRSADCDTSNPIEDERLLRVSIYWYTKSLKKRRVKRRLSDSKVIQENARWVDLSVKPATKAWSKGRNLGLGVLVEDQEGNTLRADRYFKGASCMVGTSTPKPIPTIIMDAARKTNELNRIHNLFGRNSTSALHSDIQLLPTIDICTLEFPDNYTQPSHIANLRVNACNLKKIHEQGQLLAEKERLERLATLPEFLVPNARHIRHQRQHLANKKAEDRDFDPRSSIVGSTVILRNSELTNKFNFSLANR